jgi:hypothetical protein
MSVASCLRSRNSEALLAAKDGPRAALIALLIRCGVLLSGAAGPSVSGAIVIVLVFINPELAISRNSSE